MKPLREASRRLVKGLSPQASAVVERPRPKEDEGKEDDREERNQKEEEKEL
jgi:hypothetical protein